VLTPSTAVKVNVVPTRSFWLTPRSPPVASVSRRLITNPSPVPPYARVVELSTCMKGWNSRSIRSLGMPMPVSRTDTVSRTDFAAGPGSCCPVTVTSTSPLSVNFTALLSKLMIDHLAEPSDVTDDQLGAAVVQIGHQLQALAGGGERHQS